MIIKKIEGIKIYGSFINGDSSKAFISIKVKPKSEFLYKTGPKTNGQFLKIFKDNNELYSANLSPSQEWRKIKLDLDDKGSNVTIQLIDNSPDWGEWCAVGIREQVNESK